MKKKKVIAQIAMYQITEEPRANFEPFITDPVKYAEAEADNLLSYYCKQGLLKPTKCTRPKRPWDHRAFRGRVYSVQRLPLKDHEQFLLDQFHNLDAELDMFAKSYRTNQHEEAAFRAFRIGRLFERIAVLQYDPDVKYGRPGLQQLTEHRETAIARRREERQPVWEKIVSKARSGKSWGRIKLEMRNEGTPVSRSTIARTLRRHRNNTRTK